MRIPFDLIAVILCADRIGDSLRHETFDPARLMDALWVWPLFWFASWLFHDLAARISERRTERFRAMTTIPDDALHPNQFYSRCTMIAQALSVLLYAAATAYLNWPMAVTTWPQWFGLADDASIGSFVLAKSVLMESGLIVGPYLIAMILSWIPRRQLISSRRKSLVSMLSYLSFEAKLTWLPFALTTFVMVATDVAQFLPQEVRASFERETTQSLLMVLMVFLAGTIFIPLAAVNLWDCHPLPEGELKHRLDGLLSRSGIKARAVLIWGGPNTGLLNAAMLGFWSRFRYVLLSPMLLETLTVDETEAVLGHELGHAKYGHPVLNMAVFASIILLVGSLYEALSKNGGLLGMAQIAGTMVTLILLVYFFFGAVSRQCEREADLASAELIGAPFPLITALEKVGERSGNSRNVPCWHHGSIADRVTAVLTLSGDPGESVRFHVRQKRLRIALIVGAVLLIAGQLWLQK